MTMNAAMFATAISTVLARKRQHIDDLLAAGAGWHHRACLPDGSVFEVDIYPHKTLGEPVEQLAE